MKTLFSLLVLLFVGIYGSAQPVVPASHALANGEFTYSHADSQLLGDLEPGPAGPNQNWDFSNYQPAATTSQTITDCPGNPNCADFPDANRLSINESPTSNSYSYSLFSDNEYLTIGGKQVHQNGDIEKTIYDDRDLNTLYPITYQQTYTDTWSNHSDPAGYNQSGSKTVTVDAYGTLKTPLGTFQNTLRVKTEQTIIQNAPGNITITTNSVIYMWVAPNIKGALLLLTFNDVSIPGNESVETRSFTYGNNGTLGNSDIDNSDKTVEIYPNPTSDFVNINSQEPIQKVVVKDLSGKTIKESDDKKVDLSNLLSGVYVISVELKNGKTEVKKVIKK